MIQKILNALGSNVQEKSRSPFVGSFLIVTVFNEWHTILKSSASTDFDDAEKIELFIQDMKSVLDHDLWLYAFYSILSVIAYYGINFFIKSINAFFDERLWPWMIAKISNKKVVTKERYEALKKEKEALEEDVDRLTDRLAKVSHTREEKENPEIDSNQEEVDHEVLEVMDQLFDEEFTKYEYLDLIDQVKTGKIFHPGHEKVEKYIKLKKSNLIEVKYLGDSSHSLQYNVTRKGTHIYNVIEKQLESQNKKLGEITG